MGKGSRERIVPLDKETARALRIVGSGASDNYGVPVMINARGKRLTRHGANHIVRQVATIASEKCSSLAGKLISPHLFRHTLAMNLLQAGVDLTVIQAWLGHAGLGTTHAYVEADIEMKRMALQRAGIVDQGPVRYQPTDSILQILENL
jgi:site-specific recombinase XerD